MGERRSFGVRFYPPNCFPKQPVLYYSLESGKQVLRAARAIRISIQKGTNGMITGELKNKIDGLWEIFWTGGLTNPLDVIEQMTYLMFIHDLDDSDNIKAKELSLIHI